MKPFEIVETPIETRENTRIMFSMLVPALSLYSQGMCENGRKEFAHYIWHMRRTFRWRKRN